MSNDRLVVDDHLLLQVLLGDESSELRPDGASIWTTGLWYHRLCRALADETVTGTLSRSLGGVEPHVAREVLHAVMDLPEFIGVMSLRDLGWPMSETVASGARLNLLSLEALAAAEQLSATICLAAVDDNSPLRDAAAARGVPMRIV